MSGKPAASRRACPSQRKVKVITREKLENRWEGTSDFGGNFSAITEFIRNLGVEPDVLIQFALDMGESHVGFLGRGPQECFTISYCMGWAHGAASAYEEMGERLVGDHD